MNESIYMILALIAGILLGTIFFVGLFLTVNKMTKAKKPGLMFFGSMLVRMAVILVGFYYISRESWQR
jgi:F1F0 ATPase subunit 2